MNPNINIIGTFVPDYSDSLEIISNQIAEKIKILEIDVVIIGLGSPKQDYLIYNLSKIFSNKFH